MPVGLVFWLHFTNDPLVLFGYVDNLGISCVTQREIKPMTVQ